ncbi:MAG: phosphate acetyltransferase [Chlorobi bacterium]|nr:phosphate acetyltransferase [Chlorobiota bacterium]
MNFIQQVKEKAKASRQRIVLPEAWEERTLRAANQLVREELATVILLGDPDDIRSNAAKWKLDHINNCTLINPLDHPKKQEYIDLMVSLRREKGLTSGEAGKLVEDPLYLGPVMIKAGNADGEVAGANNPTGNVLRPAFQFVRTLPGISVVSGAFFMILQDAEFGEEGILVFADCAVNPDPDASQLAEIAVTTARTARHIGGISPRVAMLSFSTKGSAAHELVDKVTAATEKAKTLDPGLEIDGELQADAAIIESIGRKKAPESKIAGKANVLVFPDLNAGNIAYKLVQRLAHAEAIGPVLQGMAAPINDLSRGCSVDDIVTLAAITAIQAAGMKK